MIDIHCHILPGVDDGPFRQEISLEMASIAAEDGIQVIIATPHTDGVRVNRELVLHGVDHLNQMLVRKQIDLEVITGYEIPYHLAGELSSTHTLGSSRFALIEFPHSYLPADALSTFMRLQDQGLRPIVAHPERNMGVLAQPDRIDELVDTGVQLQLTAASVTGELGPEIQQCSHLLLQKKQVHYVATDSHSPRFRKPVLGKAYKAVARILGRKEADMIFIQNPSSILHRDMGRNP